MSRRSTRYHQHHLTEPKAKTPVFPRGGLGTFGNHALRCEIDREAAVGPGLGNGPIETRGIEDIVRNEVRERWSLPDRKGLGAQCGV